MTNAIRIRLLLPFCMILFAVSGVLLHAASAPIRKLPDEPEESSSVVKKLPDDSEEASAEAEQDVKTEEKIGAKTEAEASKEITDFDDEKRKLVGECRADLFALIRDGDIEGARQYRADIEAWMKEKGYGKLEIPARYRKSLGVP